MNLQVEKRQKNPITTNSSVFVGISYGQISLPGIGQTGAERTKSGERDNVRQTLLPIIIFLATTTITKTSSISTQHSPDKTLQSSPWWRH
jgi:hypothetical protein